MRVVGNGIKTMRVAKRRAQGFDLRSQHDPPAKARQRHETLQQDPSMGSEKDSRPSSKTCQRRQPKTNPAAPVGGAPPAASPRETQAIPMTVPAVPPAVPARTVVGKTCTRGVPPQSSRSMPSGPTRRCSMKTKEVHTAGRSSRAARPTPKRRGEARGRVCGRGSKSNLKPPWNLNPRLTSWTNIGVPSCKLGQRAWRSRCHAGLKQGLGLL